MQVSDKYVMFDWAIKQLLREKANFEVLEGFISVFTNEEVKIEEILESESNQNSYDDKFNRVDIKARNKKGEIYIIEVQLNREIHYLERILYGAAKAITEQLHLGGDYHDVRKVISISVIYFDLGKGTDYLYRGQVQFEGVHNHDILQVTRREKKGINIPVDEEARGVRRLKNPSEIFPEYYLIRVNEFNKLAQTPIEEWMAYLKSGIIKDDTQAPGLGKAKEKLSFLTMPPKEKIAYERHLDAIRIQNDVLSNAKNEGWEEGSEDGFERGRKTGIKEGIEEGIASEALRYATELKKLGIPVEKIEELTHVSQDVIKTL
ncbi:MAG: Rpn family recombination-promoting nuclease/putative transposase [Paludibacteraceae bacterium]|nr:Rpn family recombination-promoting nuclease/putative transposase [Paludibacteraceae bacterium]